MKLRNISPYGELDIPLIRRRVAAGDTFDVTEDQAALLLEQAANFEPADRPAKAVAKTVDVPETGETPPAAVSSDEGTEGK